MAEKKKSKGGGKKDSSALYGRIAFYAVALLIVAGFFVYRQDQIVKNNRAETSKLWVDAVTSAENKIEVLRLTQLAEPVGSPEKGAMIDGSDADEATQHLVYTWNGPLNSYKIEVHCGNADDPQVIEVRPVD